ncbi:uncharacterized protein LOC126572712 [Anopheles aquasalis]|uniref:uncharacterized protein LOC126572712 n=1 Tax=Anopheles aquasalis TaxID=42839 RepID=UPI00215A182B|nr:uncharacterized protein LOC126572712 [Anopheles aquasalis]
MLPSSWLLSVPVLLSLVVGPARPALLSIASTVHQEQLLARVVAEILRSYFHHPFQPVYLYADLSDTDGRRSADLLDQVLQRIGRSGLVLAWDLPSRPGVPRLFNLALLDSLPIVGPLCRVLDERNDPSGRYVIALTERYATQHQLDKLLDRLFGELFERRIVNVNVVVRERTPSVAVYTYYPFAPGQCRQPRTQLVARYGGGERTWWPPGTMRTLDLYPGSRLADLHNCPLRVGTFEAKPYTIVHRKVDGYEELGGFEGDLLRLVSERLRFRTNLTVSRQWGTIGPQGNSTGLMRLVQDEQVDLAIACLAIDPSRNAYLRPGTTHYTSTVRMAVPQGRPYTPFEKLFRPFRTDCWIAVSCCLAVLVCLVAGLGTGGHSVARDFVYGPGVRMPLLRALYLMFGGSVQPCPRRNFARTLFLLWLAKTLVLRTVYQASLYRYLQRSAYQPPLATLDEVYRSSLELHMVHLALRFFVDRPEVRARAHLIPAGLDTLGMMVGGMADRAYHDRAVVCPFDMVAYANRLNRRAHRRQMVHVTRDPITLFPLTIYYPRRSMLTDAFDREIRKIAPAGLMQYWVRNYGDYELYGGVGDDGAPSATGRPQQLTNGHLAGAYQVLGVAHGCAVVLLLLELVSRRVRWLGQLFDSFE